MILGFLGVGLSIAFMRLPQGGHHPPVQLAFLRSLLLLFR
jgi:hypothetical protein